MAEFPAVAFSDRSHWGRIQVSGADRLRFLHNQSTNAFEQLSPGTGCETVFVSSTARTVDLASAYVDDESVLLLVSPGMAAELISWMDRYIFFADQVTLEDRSETTFAITLLGPEVDRLLDQLGLPKPDMAPCSHTRGRLSIANATVQIARDTGLTTSGYTLIGTKESGAQPWLVQWLGDQGVPCLSSQQWEVLRIQQGRPMPGQELTDQDNPLEAGLWHAISFEKGCYIGQETIARLNTYQGVKKQLWGLKLGTPTTDVSLTLEGKPVGKITSMVADDSGIWGLGYLRTKAGGAGLTVTVGETTADVVDLPFTSRGYLDGTA
ncbi:MAG: folate-binding protein [Cyanobacteria bacterium P01_A01_bin.15]